MLRCREQRRRFGEVRPSRDRGSPAASPAAAQLGCAPVRLSTPPPFFFLCVFFFYTREK